MESVSVKPKTINVVSNYKTELGKYLIPYEPDKYEELSESEALEFKNSINQEIVFEIHNNKFSFVGY